MRRMPCNHLDVVTHTTTTMFAGELVLNVRAQCNDCGAPFLFKGIQPGQSTTAPTSSAGGMTARLPVELAVMRELRCTECERVLWGLPPLDLVEIECGPTHLVTMRDAREDGPRLRRFECRAAGTQEIDID